MIQENFAIAFIGDENISVAHMLAFGLTLRILERDLGHTLKQEVETAKF